MKKVLVILSFLFLSFLQVDVTAQTDNLIVEESDSTFTEKGDLSLLIERIYLANKAYKTGIYGFEEIDEEQLLQHVKELYEKNGIYPSRNLIPEQPVQAAVIKEKEEGVEQIRMKGDELNEIPANSIYSIELIFSPPVAVALYGIGAVHQLVVRVKD